jgi:L-fuconolactonase
MTHAFDSHSHAWNAWPYPKYPARPASGDALLGAMDDNDIGRALIVCADIDPTHENNAYVAELVRSRPDRLAYVIDSDCYWSPHHHTRGAVSRLQRLIEDFPDAAGVTHYVVDLEVDDWFRSRGGRAWLDCVASSYGVLSLSAGPAWAAVVHEIAREHLNLTILWHHLAGVSMTQRHLFAHVAATAAAPNIAIKLSGFHYLSKQSTAAPWKDVWSLLDDHYSVFGPGRLCWGSDFPASLRYTDYSTSLAAADQWMGRLGAAERAAIMGGNLARIVTPRSSGSPVL